MKKVGIISQARMTSTRLPGKVLKEINGVSLLKYHIDRTLQSSYPLYIATTTNETDNPIVALCEEEAIPYYRGSEDHVLSRYYECAQENELDVIVRVTSDCPLIDGHYIKKGLELYLAQNNEWLYLSSGLSNTFPRGFDFEIFSFHLLKQAFNNATTKPEIEHVTPYIYLDRDPRIVKAGFQYHQDKSSYRVTVDTTEDFELIKRLIEGHQAHTLGVDKIVAILDEEEELVAINAHIEQKKLRE